MPPQTTTPPGASTQPKVSLTTDNNVTDFYFDQTPAMPAMRVTAVLEGVSSPPPNLVFQWSFRLEFSGAETPHGKPGTPATLSLKSVGGVLDVPSLQWGVLRGGRLTVGVSVVVQGQTLTASRTDLRILGTNPTEAQISGVANDATVMAILRHESSMRQFGGDRWPLFSSDNKGGAGLGQITPASEPQRWNWSVNVQAAVSKYNYCYGLTNTYVNSLRNSAGLTNKVTALNAKRAQQNAPALTVTVPAFSDGQRIRDAVRGYNGWAGSDPIESSLHLHQYRLACETNGDLTVVITPNSNNATAVWEEVPAADRPQGTGDPDYVNHVLSPSM